MIEMLGEQSEPSAMTSSSANPFKGHRFHVVKKHAEDTACSSCLSGFVTPMMDCGMRRVSLCAYSVEKSTSFCSNVCVCVWLRAARALRAPVAQTFSQVSFASRRDAASRPPRQAQLHNCRMRPRARMGRRSAHSARTSLDLHRTSASSIRSSARDASGTSRCGARSRSSERGRCGRRARASPSATNPDRSARPHALRAVVSGCGFQLLGAGSVCILAMHRATATWSDRCTLACHAAQRRRMGR